MFPLPHCYQSPGPLVLRLRRASVAAKSFGFSVSSSKIPLSVSEEETREKERVWLEIVVYRIYGVVRFMI